MQQPKAFEHPNTADIKLVTIEHPNTSRKLSKTIRQTEKVSQVSSANKNSDNPLYSETKKTEKFLNKNNVKITKRSHAFKGYASSYNVKILNSFNPELQLKDTESAIENKLKDLLSELKYFKFVTTLDLEFRKVQRDDKTLYSSSYSNSVS